MTRRLAAVLCGLGAFAQGQPPSGDWLLQKIDEYQTAGNKVVVAEMIVHTRRGSRTIRFKSWIEGVDRAFTEYLDPPREAGTKTLKLANQLWIYTPATDRTIQMAGHMLRQSVMGSDLSYEDLMEDPKLRDLYDSKVTGEASVLERACWILHLAAKTGKDPAYHSRKIWVDKERFVVMREERYATSGRLLKTADVTSVRLAGRRWIADRAVFKDALKNEAGTEFTIQSIEFDASIPEHIFSKASLRK